MNAGSDNAVVFPGGRRQALPVRLAIFSAVAVAAGLLLSLCVAGQASAQAVDGLDQGTEISSHPKKKIHGPSRKGGTYVARLLIGTAVRRRPGRGKNVWFARTHTKWSGAGQRLMVLDSRRARGETWLKVRLPIRPNNAAGWIPRDRVQLAHSRRFILVDTSRRLLRVYRNGRVVTRHKVVVGAPSTPTPVGLFALHDRVKQANPNDFVGSWILTLTAHSRQLRRFDGGDGLVAFHGRGGASFLDPLGSARSHGCIRMNNSRIASLAKAMMGTAVRVQR
ncbi:MAG: L,D-transpeptidase [Solirubrobacterales bacterium]|nr:L,D-transpeptidase [Solirubrobacterales bacterium]